MDPTLDPNAIGLLRSSVNKKTQEGLRDESCRTYAVYACRLDSDQSFAGGKRGFGHLFELEDGFDGTLLREPESVHGGPEHRYVKERIGAMVLYRSPNLSSQSRSENQVSRAHSKTLLILDFFAQQMFSGGPKHWNPFQTPLKI